jgi:DNA-binding NarL/FixJ family response regulator
MRFVVTLPTVIIVEDEDDFIYLYKKFLKLFGIKIIGFAKNGQEAIKLLKRIKRKPDLVIMDYKMPNMNGIEATKEIKKFLPDLKIIMVSGDPDIKIQAFSVGITGFVEKNSSFLHLIDKIIDFLE